jgi:hypothetical protein
MHVLEPAWETVKREFEAARGESEREARRRITYEFNQFFRRLRQYQAEADWFVAVLECAGKFASESAIFAVSGGKLELRGQHNLGLADGFSMAAKEAAGFAAAIESKEPTIALRSAGEVSEALGSADRSQRAHLFPVLNGERVVAIVFAAGEQEVDANALELIANLGSAALERRANANIHTQIIQARAAESDDEIAPEKDAARGENGATEHASQALPSWGDLPQEQREQHIRAQRFSRVAVAEMLLQRAEACRAGRQQNNLYLYLKNEINKARETYRSRFMNVPSMVDYLHLELIRAAVDGNENNLGAEYPGPLA